jgi:hypothetical protein
MKLVISGTFTPDVSRECRALVKDFEKRIRREITEIELASPLEYIVLFPTVLNPDITPLRDRVTFRPKEKAVYVGKSLSHGEWVVASNEARIELMAKNIEGSLKQIEERHMPSADLAALLDALEKAKVALIRNQQQ